MNRPELERALGIPLLRGRSFTQQDDSASERVVMINEAAATRFYPGADPDGRLIAWNGEDHWRIIGVLGSTHLDSLSMGPSPSCMCRHRRLLAAGGRSGLGAPRRIEVEGGFRVLGAQRRWVRRAARWTFSRLRMILRVPISETRSHDPQST